MNNTQMNLNKNKFNSDVQKYAMSAFDDIICRVRRSNLNFQLQLSPFSAVISLKKSVVKNSEGVQIIPEPKEIKANNDALQRSYAEATEKLEAAGKKILSLEDQLAELSRTQKETNKSKKDICDPKELIFSNFQNFDSISDLKNNNMALQSIVNDLETRCFRLQKENCELKKALMSSKNDCEEKLHSLDDLKKELDSSRNAQELILEEIELLEILVDQNFRIPCHLDISSPLLFVSLHKFRCVPEFLLEPLLFHLGI